MAPNQVRRNEQTSRTRNNDQRYHHRNHRNHPHTSIDLSNDVPRDHYRFRDRHERLERATKSDPLAICYSYLIAIISSFLVVLGLYLSLTKFNFRFLYISVAGILLEALSACIYCMSNIRQSKKTQHKQQARDIFILDGSNNIILSSSPRSSGVARQQATRPTPTHVLSNRTLNPTAINLTIDINSETSQSNNDGNNTSRGDGNTTNGTVNSISCVAHENEYAQSDLLQQTTSAGVAAQLKTTTLTNRHVIPDRNDDDDNDENGSNKNTDINELTSLRPPEHQSSQSEEENVGGSIRDIEQQQQSCPDFVDYTATPSTSQTTATATIAHNTSQKNDSHLVETSRDEVPQATFWTISNEADHSEQQQTVASMPPSEGIKVYDFTTGAHASTSLFSASSPSAVRRKNTNLNQGRNMRQISTRRTLVMGLGGEEEIIEINEDDLDNMSILPPPYESIVSPTSGIASVMAMNGDDQTSAVADAPVKSNGMETTRESCQLRANSE